MPRPADIVVELLWTTNGRTRDETRYYPVTRDKPKVGLWIADRSLVEASRTLFWTLAKPLVFIAIPELRRLERCGLDRFQVSRIAFRRLSQCGPQLWRYAGSCDTFWPRHSGKSTVQYGP
jgi:hypothetical protein